MPADRLTMRKIREILRLRWSAELSGRATARSCNVSPVTVTKYENLAKEAGLTWPLPPEFDDDAALEALLFPETTKASERPLPDFQHIYRQLKRKGVTLTLLWHEYQKEYQDRPDCYQFSQFCEHYRNWSKSLELVMRQQHKAGEKLFVDYAGQTVPITDPQTGQLKHHQLFVDTLGASNYTYVEVHESQSLENWCSAHIRAFEFFGGTCERGVYDNMKTAVDKVCSGKLRVINKRFTAMVSHYLFEAEFCNPAAGCDLHGFLLCSPGSGDG